jgi:hypothetical protein
MWGFLGTSGSIRLLRSLLIGGDLILRLLNAKLGENLDLQNVYYISFKYMVHRAQGHLLCRSSNSWNDNVCVRVRARERERSWNLIYITVVLAVFLCNTNKHMFIISVADTFVYNKSCKYEWRLCTIIPSKRSRTQHYNITCFGLCTGQWGQTEWCINPVSTQQHHCKYWTLCLLILCKTFLQALTEKT